MYSSPVLELYFDDPSAVLHIREIARQTKLHPNTALRDIRLLVKEKILEKKVTRAVVNISANRDNALFVDLKRLSNLRKIFLSRITDKLSEEYGAPAAIILFGSYAKGEDILQSDVDIAVITKRKSNSDWTAQQSIFRRRIQVHEIDLAKATKEFINNLANGIVLKGYLAI